MKGNEITEPEVEYAPMPPELVKLGNDFRTLHEAFTDSKMGLLSALELSHQYMAKCGQFLLDAQKKMKHGQWYPWLRECAGINPRTAQRYMRQITNATPLTDLNHQKVVDAYVELNLIEPPPMKKPKATKRTAEKSDLLKIKGLVYKLWELLESTPDKTRAALELKALMDWQVKVAEKKRQDDDFEKV